MQEDAVECQGAATQGAAQRLNNRAQARLSLLLSLPPLSTVPQKATARCACEMHGVL